MVRIIKGILLGLFLGILFVIDVGAQTINSASCAANDVATALSQVTQDGTTVVIPACTSGVSWGSQTAHSAGGNMGASVDSTGQLSFNVANSITIQGQGSTTGSDSLGNPTGYNDQTVLIYNNASGKAMFVVNSWTGGKYLRITGITTEEGSSAVQNTSGVWDIGGKAESTSCSAFPTGTPDGSCFRMDHNHFYELNNVFCTVYGWIYGVIDHNFFQFSVGDSNGVRISFSSYNNDPSNNGNGSWADADNWGTNKFIFLEDNTFDQIGTGGSGYIAAVNDCNGGGRQVIRYNTMNGFVYVQTHEMEGSARGCRATEIYGNLANGFNGPSGNGTGAMGTFHTSRMGGSLVWGNNLTGYGDVMNVFLDRDGDNGHDFTLVPNGFGYCGNNSTTQGLGQTGDSPWDPNWNTTTGYACLDQPARGQSDTLTGCWPSESGSCTGVTNTTQGGTAKWPRNALSPLYLWSNTWNVPVSGNLYFTYGDPLVSSLVVANQDVYLELPNANNIATFNGTAGIGCGAGSSAGSATSTCAHPVAQPSACTPGNSSLTTLYNSSGAPGVAYWNTTNNTLYVCTAANTWSSYYTPYTYPHPLTVGDAPISLSPPTNVQATGH
jgi:hypothetical protein